MKKYELVETDKTTPNGKPLFRVVALRDFGDVRKGDKGGYIESEDNLSHEGNCWVYGNDRVYGEARVAENAFVSWDITVVDNGNGTSTLYADAVFEPAEPECDHTYADTCWCYRRQPVYVYCPKCGEKL